MKVQHLSRPVSAERIGAMVRSLLQAAPLCAIATISPAGRAHVNTAYFAWDDDLSIVWVSAPQARHSRNIGLTATAAIAIFDSHQTWGKEDRGIQLFGPVRELRGKAVDVARAVYAKRFRDARGLDPQYRYYRLSPRRVKLFDERNFGGATFVTAAVGAGGTVHWLRTERYG